MSHYTYEVIRETPGYHIDSYSDTEVVDRFDNAAAALKMVDSLRKKSDGGESFYVQVQWGSIDNV